MNRRPDDEAMRLAQNQEMARRYERSGCIRRECYLYKRCQYVNCPAEADKGATT